MPDATSISSIRDRRWWFLGVVGLAQLMVVLDATIVNIALPSAQRALGFSNTDRQWVVTAYALAFGGLLLLGGRIADYAGRKRVFLIGLLGFAGASALGGAAGNAGTLFAARGLQGQSINVATGRSITLNALLKMLGRLLGRPARAARRPPRPGDIRHSLADVTLARRLLGYRPFVDFETGLEQTVDWYRRSLIRR